MSGIVLKSNSIVGDHQLPAIRGCGDTMAPNERSTASSIHATWRLQFYHAKTTDTAS